MAVKAVNSLLEARTIAAPVRRRPDPHAFQRQHLLLGGRAAGSRKAADLAAGGKDAVARNDQRHRIGAERLAGFARQPGMAGRFGQLAIGRGLPKPSFSRRVVDGQPERVDAVEIDRNAGEIDRFALGNSGLTSSIMLGDGRWRRAGTRGPRGLCRTAVVRMTSPGRVRQEELRQRRVRSRRWRPSRARYSKR